MNLRTVNAFFGYGLFALGGMKFIFTILLMIQGSTNTALSEGEIIFYSLYPIFTLIIGGAQLLLAIGSVIMIFVNMSNQPAVIPGYLWGLGAILLEVTSPFLFYVLVLFAECGMYIKAGTSIISKNINYDDGDKKSKKTVKNQEWYLRKEK